MTPEAVVDEFIARVVRLDLDAACELVTDDVEYDNVPMGKVFGPDGIKSILGPMAGQLTGVEWIVHKQVAAGNLVLNERTDRFIKGDVSADLPVAGVFEVRDGKIALWRDYFDMTTTAPAPTQARVCISADSHVTEPPGTYIDRIDAAYRDRAPRLEHHDTLGDIMLVDNGQSLVPMWLVAAAGRPADEIRLDGGHTFDELHRGGWDPEARLADQDIDGVSAEVVYPSVGMILCNHPDRDYQAACFSAYNEWIAEFCAFAPDRLIGLGQTAVRTPEDGIADLERIKARGLRGVMLPGFPGVADWDDPMYDELWDAIVELELPASFHILTSGSDTPFAGNVRGPKLNTFSSIIRGNQDIIGTLIFGAVFERHPALKVVCVEADAGWAPHYMYRADHAYDRHRNWLTAGELSKPPSEYFRENVYLTFQDDWVAFRVADLMNVERLMWANDFPHSDATWPDSQAMLDEHARHLTPNARDRILHANCADLYGISV